MGFSVNHPDGVHTLLDLTGHDISTIPGVNCGIEWDKTNPIKKADFLTLSNQVITP
jgi:hypothetical protein